MDLATKTHSAGLGLELLEYLVRVLAYWTEALVHSSVFFYSDLKRLCYRIVQKVTHHEALAVPIFISLVRSNSLANFAQNIFVMAQNDKKPSR